MVTPSVGAQPLASALLAFALLLAGAASLLDDFIVGDALCLRALSVPAGDPTGDSAVARMGAPGGYVARFAFKKRRPE